jgi:hypothetical protein
MSLWVVKYTHSHRRSRIATLVLERQIMHTKHVLSTIIRGLRLEYVRIVILKRTNDPSIEGDRERFVARRYL